MSNSNVPKAAGLIITECEYSKINGQPPDNEPRTNSSRNGIASDVSTKRKIRNLVMDKNSPFWIAIRDEMSLNDDEFRIHEDPKLTLDEKNRHVLDGTFYKTFVDGRWYGCCYLGDSKSKGYDAEAFQNNRRTGAIQVGLALSVAPVNILRATLTKMQGVEEDKSRGMAPQALRVVEHALYYQPFLINPIEAAASSCTPQDIQLFLKLIPHMYTMTSACQRVCLRIVHAWYFTYKSILGRGQLEIINALRPIKKEDPEKPSHSFKEYYCPLPSDQNVRDIISPFVDHLATFTDLMTDKDWMPGIRGK